jgi:hypothetical protein
MTPEKIRALLAWYGIKASHIADRLHVSRSMVTRTIDGTSVSRRVREGIATSVRKKLEDLWPSVKDSLQKRLRVSKRVVPRGIEETVVSERIHKTITKTAGKDAKSYQKRLI